MTKLEIVLIGIIFFLTVSLVMSLTLYMDQIGFITEEPAKTVSRNI